MEIIAFKMAVDEVKKFKKPNLCKSITLRDFFDDLTIRLRKEFTRYIKF